MNKDKPYRVWAFQCDTCRDVFVITMPHWHEDAGAPFPCINGCPGVYRCAVQGSPEGCLGVWEEREYVKPRPAFHELVFCPVETPAFRVKDAVPEGCLPAWEEREYAPNLQM